MTKNGASPPALPHREGAGVAGAEGATLLGTQCPNIVRFCEMCAKTGGFATLMMVNVARGALLPSLCFLLVRHDVEYLAIGFAHGLCTDAGEVVDGLVDTVVDDAFGRRHTLAFHREYGGEHGGVDTRGNLQRARGLRTVAEHSREVGNHVFHRTADALVVATHEVGDAHAGADAGDDTAAEGGQAAEALLYVDGGEVGEGQRAYELFFGVLVLFGIDGHGIGGADALVAGAGVRHYGNHSTAHARIAGSSGLRDDVRVDAVAEDSFRQWTVDGLSEIVAVVVFQCFACSRHIQLLRLQDEPQLLHRRFHSEVVDEAQT